MDAGSVRMTDITQELGKHPSPLHLPPPHLLPQPDHLLGPQLGLRGRRVSGRRSEGSAVPCRMRPASSQGTAPTPAPARPLLGGFDPRQIRPRLPARGRRVRARPVRRGRISHPLRQRITPCQRACALWQRPGGPSTGRSADRAGGFRPAVVQVSARRHPAHATPLTTPPPPPSGA